MTQLIMLIIFALSLNLWSLQSMLLLMGGYLVLFFHQKNKHFFSLMKRLKWFYIVMFSIFLLNTPGEHIVSWSYGFKPTYEGLQLGVEQVLRITLMLAALSFMLMQNTVEQLISGLYFLLKPLSNIGFDVKRFAARLSLTLHYVEMQQADAKQGKALIKSLGERLDHAFIEDEQLNMDVTLQYAPLVWIDYAAIATMLVILGVALMMQGY